MALTSNPVNWFELPAKDISRATEFYEHVFGAEFSLQEMNDSFSGSPLKMAMFSMKPDAPGAGGAIIKSEGYTPSHEGALIYFAVDDIEGTLKKADQKGGKILGEKMGIGEHGFIGLFEDTEGNRVGLHSRK